MRSSGPSPSGRTRSGPGVAALLVVPLMLTGLAAASPAPAAAAPARVSLPGTVPPWAAAAADQGEVAATAPVTVRVHLAGHDRTGLAALARAVSDPRSSAYGHYLTAAQVKARFGAAPQQTADVRGWLTAAGFRVLGSTPHYLSVQGDAAAVRRAFGTRLHSYRRDGHLYRAPVAAATVPRSVAAAVLSVVGLDDAPHNARPGAVRLDPVVGTSGAAAPAGGGSGGSARRDVLPPPGAALSISGPFSHYFGETPATGTPEAYGAVQPYALKGYTGAQLRRAYGADGPAQTGAGVKVAVVDAYDSPTIVADTATYSAAHGEAPYRSGQLIRNDPAAWTHTADPSAKNPDGCGASGWYGEQSLDVEAVHGVAPDATIVYTAAASCADNDLSDALQRIVDGRLADIVSCSWGEAESQSDPSTDPVYDDLFMRGAVEGVGFYAATGDDGDFAAATGTAQSGMPASLPWVTAVGGTSLATDSAGAYRFETGWGSDSAPLAKDGKTWTTLPGTFSSGAGGGTSKRVREPVYQYGVVPDALTRTNGSRHRVVPDVAAVADPATGFLVGQTQTWPGGGVHYGEYRIGGTSLATPVFAAVQALAQQAQGGVSLGFANPALYQRGGTTAFHDVTDTPLGATTQLAMVRVDFHNDVDAGKGLDTTLRTMGHDSSLHAVTGFDDVTGLGSPGPGYLRSYQSGPAGLLPVAP